MLIICSLLSYEVTKERSLPVFVVGIFFISNQKVASGKGRKERKQGRKGGPTKPAPSSGSGDPPDMGALCI